MLIRTDNSTSETIIGSILILIVIASLGFVASTGNLIFIAIAFASLCGIFILFSPVLLLLTTIIGSIVVAGLTEMYLPRMELVRWGFAICANLFFFYILSHLSRHDTTLKEEPVPSILVWCVLFIFVVLFSTALNNLTRDAFIIGVKGYFQIWGIFFALAILPWDEKFIRKLPKLFFIIALIQLPFVLHQYFMLVPLRQGMQGEDGVVAIDIVSGTFGGKIYAGAANAALTLFMFIVFSGLVALWSNKVIGFFKFITLSTLIMFPVFINSTKMAAFYFIIVFIIVFRKEAIHKPFSFLVKLMGLIAILGLLVASVIKHLPEDRDINNWKELLEFTYSYNLTETNPYKSNLSRGYVMKMWWEPVESHTVSELLFGYGPASTRVTEKRTGLKVTRAIGQSYDAGHTAVSAILWETGIIGILFITGLFLSAFSTAGRLINKHRYEPYELSIFQAIQTAVVLLFASLFHKNYFLYHLASQAILVTILGYLVYWERRMNNDQADQVKTSN